MDRYAHTHTCTRVHRSDQTCRDCGNTRVIRCTQLPCSPAWKADQKKRK
jgi:hypothetical protein